MRRWGAQRPIKLANELSARANELPPAVRQRLIVALQDQQVKKTA
jgi:hypothetical protein